LLGEESVSVRVPIQAADSRSLRAIVASTPSQAGPYQSVQVVLDNVRLLGQGSAGGYFYKVYLNLPQSGDASSSQERYLLGTVGPFELDASAHHGNAGRLEFPATEVLAKLAPDQLNDLTVSLVRVSGRNAPKGRVVAIGELRVEMSSDEPNDTSPQEVKPRDVPYR
jgi:tyrosinase